jgi:hypothetical protein
MADSQLTKAEWQVQLAFTVVEIAMAFALVAALSNFYDLIRDLPDRTELGPRRAQLTFDPVALDTSGFGPLRVAGAWRVTGEDPRFGGVSGLATDRGQLLALTDSGVLIRFTPPGRRRTTASIWEVPRGPNKGQRKTERDSEALLRDPGGRGWWVSYETRNQLWLYDLHLTRGLQRIRLAERWKENVGVEALAAGKDGEMLLFPEAGTGMFRLRGTVSRRLPLAGRSGRIAEASSDGQGGVLIVERRLGITGFSSTLTQLDHTAAGYRLGRKIPLALGPIDVPEALAVERRRDGSRRLWLMTDDNLQSPFRTLLIALDWPAGA